LNEEIKGNSKTVSDNFSVLKEADSSKVFNSNREKKNISIHGIQGETNPGKKASVGPEFLGLSEESLKSDNSSIDKLVEDDVLPSSEFKKSSEKNSDS
jgi:hypothetical protein